MTSTPTISGYEMIALLGTGSFASVWSAYDLRLDREVAVKVLSEDSCQNPEVRRNFMNEARVLVTSESHRLARGFVVDETTDGRPYLVMAMADRGTLGERMSRREAVGQVFSPLETFSIIGALADAIADVHALGHLHRDVKPNNVLIMEIPKGSSSQSVAGLAFDERIVLSDFGLVGRLDVSGSGSVGGSPGYVAPEQAGGGGEIDERCDLYPLGVIALEMMTGRADDRPTTLAQAATARHDIRQRLERAGVVLADGAIDLLDGLVRPNPAERLGTAADVAQRCDHIVCDLGVVGDERRGLWGQDLHLTVPVTAPVADPAEATVVRPRDVRAPVTSPLPAAEPVVQPSRSRASVALDVGIAAGAIALVVLAALLWFT